MFGLLKKSKPQQDVYFPFKTVFEKEQMIFDKKQFASNGFDFVQKQRKRQNMCDDEKWVRSGDRPFTKAKRSNRDVPDQNKLLTYARWEKMFVHPTVPIRLTEPSRVRFDWSFGDRTDRTGARLPRPTRHSKAHGRARLSLGREETEDGHAFSSGGPSGQSRKRSYLYPVHPSGSDEPGHYLKGHL
ncbi:hypothetical protein F2Q70_00014548 [Brassica cretica]|uniref:Uncharacterized protein n=1 Tax=Brassica cretica TaxID=69181 RepID=A0A8S9HVB0_BRACR|nr:hypothetical protein F2Q70_00014548 [Brassica cretica]